MSKKSFVRKLIVLNVIDKNPPTREEVDLIGGLEIYELKEGDKKEKIIVDYKKNIYSL
jgi:hypothetical protein